MQNPTSRRSFLARLAASIAAIVVAPDAAKALGVPNSWGVDWGEGDWTAEHYLTPLGPTLDVHKVADDHFVRLSYDADDAPVDVFVDGVLWPGRESQNTISLARPSFGAPDRVVELRATKDGQTVTQQSSVPPRAAVVLAVENGRWSDPASWVGGRMPDPDDVALIPAHMHVLVDRALTFNP